MSSMLIHFYSHKHVIRPEISWQEFRNNYLEPGTVEKVVVVNKSVAK